ncbi:hypothetical protein [Gaoshiqia sp. Z1-71]|uniref:hypothetical protein n=1 Tax=Gaoshiqia hydrogeniformans TaxID=3290090 RepID=UPI003BF7A913
MVEMVDIIRKLENSLKQLDVPQKSICDIMLAQLRDTNNKLYSKQSDLITDNKYIELFIAHNNDHDTNFTIILFKNYIELSCAGFTFQFDYETEVFKEYFSSLLRGEYSVIRTSIGAHIIQDQLIWNQKGLESKIRKSFLYFLKFFINQKKVVKKSYQSLSFISN